MDRLPYEIWQLVAGYLSIEDIESLSQTCIAFRTFTNERTVWNEVIRDLLKLSPNPTVLRYMHDRTVGQLRSIARRFTKAHESLSRGTSFSTTTFELPPNVRAAKLLSCGPYIVMVLSSGHVQVISCDDGRLIDKWDPTDQPNDITHATMMLCESIRYGLMVLCVVDEPSPIGISRQLWLFQVAGSMHPKLLPLIINPTEDFVELVAARDDLLLFTKEEPDYELLVCLHIPSEIAHHGGVGRRFARLDPNYRNSDINMIVVISDCTFCLFSGNHVAFFRIPDESVSAIDGPVEAHPYGVYIIEELESGYSPGPVIRSEDFILFTFVTNEAIYSVEAPDQPDMCTVIRWLRPSRSLSSVSVQGLNTCWAEDDSEDSGNFVLIYDANPTRLDPVALSRIRCVPRGTSKRWIPKSSDMKFWDLDFDEWSGRTVIQWWRDDKVGLRSYVTVVSDIRDSGPGL